MAKVKDNEQEVVGTDNGTQQDTNGGVTVEKPQLSFDYEGIIAGFPKVDSIQTGTLPTYQEAEAVGQSANVEKKESSTNQSSKSSQTAYTDYTAARSNPNWQKDMGAFEKEQMANFRIGEDGKMDEHKYLTEVLGIDKARLEREREAKRKDLEGRRKEANLYNAFSVLGDMFSTAIGGNVYKRDKNTIAADAKDDLEKAQKEATEKDTEIKNKLEAARQAYAKLLRDERDRLDEKYAPKKQENESNGGSSTVSGGMSQGVTNEKSKVYKQPDVVVGRGGRGGSGTPKEPKTMIVNHQENGKSDTITSFVVDEDRAKEYAQIYVNYLHLLDAKILKQMSDLEIAHENRQISEDEMNKQKEKLEQSRGIARKILQKLGTINFDMDSDQTTNQINFILQSGSRLFKNGIFPDTNEAGDYKDEFDTQTAALMNAYNKLYKSSPEYIQRGKELMEEINSIRANGGTISDEAELALLENLLPYKTQGNIDIEQTLRTNLK